MKTKSKTKTPPDRNEPLFSLLCSICDEMNDLRAGIVTLVQLGGSELASPNVTWLGRHLLVHVDKCIAAADASDERYIKPWRDAQIAARKPSARARA